MAETEEKSILIGAFSRDFAQQKSLIDLTFSAVKSPGMAILELSMNSLSLFTQLWANNFDELNSEIWIISLNLKWVQEFNVPGDSACKKSEGGRGAGIELILSYIIHLNYFRQIEKVCFLPNTPVLNVEHPVAVRSGSKIDDTVQQTISVKNAQEAVYPTHSKQRGKLTKDNYLLQGFQTEKAERNVSNEKSPDFSAGDRLIKKYGMADVVSTRPSAIQIS